MSCDPERVTGFVDAELPSEEAAEVAAHLETCARQLAQLSRCAATSAASGGSSSPSTKPVTRSGSQLTRASA